MFFGRIDLLVERDETRRPPFSRAFRAYAARGLARRAIALAWCGLAAARRAPGRPSRRAPLLGLSVALTTALVAACSSAPVGPGFYRVEKGDTLSSIARRNGQSVSSLVRWNAIPNPNQLEVDQVLRVAPPRGEAGVRTRATDTPVASGFATDATPRPTPSPAARPVPALPTGGPPVGTSIALAWPAPGPVVNAFDGSRNKGVDIGGRVGDPVSAAAAGQVAYVGQLRGYGNLLIIKHNGGFLTSYAHLQRANVKEGQSIGSGQAIATLGDTETTQPMLHFELRYNGQPVNPIRYLPSR